MLFLIPQDKTPREKSEKGLKSSVVILINHPSISLILIQDERIDNTFLFGQYEKFLGSPDVLKSFQISLTTIYKSKAPRTSQNKHQTRPNKKELWTILINIS